MELQVSGGFMEETRGAGSSTIGTLLGWGMAAIYMGGRLPQICLNVRISLSSKFLLLYSDNKVLYCALY